VDATKDKVGRPVPTVTIPPGIDNPLVVTEEAEVLEGPVLAAIKDGMNEKFEADTFHSADVSLAIQCSPVWA
jgi:hypothetical protein